MNHSNKDGKPYAESDEGRPLIKENAHQPNTYPTQCEKRVSQGLVVVVRYADDIVLGFQHQTEADRFLEKFRERLGKFGLELHPDKTRRIEFGRYAEQNRERRGEGRPETFDFLGFTHISGKNGKGYFTVKRKTIRKPMRGKLQ
jgi:RNA-directed DNA polymerase